MKKRPFGVTVLAILAGIAAVLAGVHALQALGIFPFMIGPFSVHAFSFWSFLMWALMVWVWVWLVQMLWRMDKQRLGLPGGDHRLQPDPRFHRHAGRGAVVGCQCEFPGQRHHPDLRHAAGREARF